MTLQKKIINVLTELDLNTETCTATTD